MGLKQQALYCYRKVYSLDPTNVDALWDRASLAVEMGELKTVRFPAFLLYHELIVCSGTQCVHRYPQANTS